MDNRPEDLKSWIGNRIRDVRSGMGKSQKELAVALGWEPKSQSQISQWERGNVLPGLDQLQALADLAGMSLDALLRDDDGAEPSPPGVLKSGPDGTSDGFTLDGTRETDRRLREIVQAAGSDLQGLSEAVFDLALSLRADALRQREVRATIEAEAYRKEAETAARRQAMIEEARDRLASGTTPPAATAEDAAEAQEAARLSDQLEGSEEGVDPESGQQRGGRLSRLG